MSRVFGVGAAREAWRAGGAAWHRRVVLVVDDFPALLGWAARAFERGGWTVLIASDEAEAHLRRQEAIERGAPVALLVTGLEMPSFDGVALAHELRALDAALAVVAITGHTDEQTAWGGATLERSALFQKPVHAEALLDAAESLLPHPPEPRTGDPRAEAVRPR